MSHHNRVHQLFVDHAQALQVFFRKRLRHLRDTRDLTQEVYLRLLRAGQERPIRNPEAYLFTVASNLLKERRVMELREAGRVEVSDPLSRKALEALGAEEPEAGSALDLDRHRQVLRTLLPDLPARTRLVLYLAFEKELSQQQIAERLGVSKPMVQKILARAVSYCRKRMVDREGP